MSSEDNRLQHYSCSRDGPSLSVTCGKLAAMSDWAKERYGDPCRECGFRWSLTDDEAAAIVAETPARYGQLLEGHDPSMRHPGLGWSARGYVCHVTDNLRIWAERMVGAARGGRTHVGGYDNDLLATARRYESVSIRGALWSLGHAAEEWSEAFGMARDAHVVFVHQERGEQTILDVARTNAHDAVHHGWDIERTVG
jgi:hypothetical protein